MTSAEVNLGNTAEDAIYPDRVYMTIIGDFIGITVPEIINPLIHPDTSILVYMH